MATLSPEEYQKNQGYLRPGESIGAYNSRMAPVVADPMATSGTTKPPMTKEPQTAGPTFGVGGVVQPSLLNPVQGAAQTQPMQTKVAASGVTQPAEPNIPADSPKLEQAKAIQTGQNYLAGGSLTMPSNGSVVDLLNMAGQDSSFAAREQLAKQYGIAGYTGSAQQNTDLAKKYLDAFNANKDTPAPQTNAAGRSAVQGYLDQTQVGPQEDPQRTFFDEYMSMNPIVKTMYDAINQELSAPVTRISFAEEYNKLVTEQGIPGLQTELMNLNNIIDGTEDDIRTEIGKVGGFATESQVQALKGARNKTLLKQANVLQQQLALKEDYVNQIMQFSQLDREQVEKDVDRKLGLTEKLATLQQGITNAAKENYENVIDKVGFTGLAESFGGDTQAMSMAERALGLPKGALSNELFLAQENIKESKPLQFVSGTENQASGVFDPNTGVFTPRGGGGSGSGGAGGGVGGLGVGNGLDNPAVKAALDVILGSSSTLSKQQQANIVNAINRGEDPFTVIKNQAKNIMGQTLATSLSNNEKARAALIAVNNSINAYYASGGKTDIFKGNMEEVAAKLGTVKDEKLREVATEVEAAIQIYRNAISGTAYSNQEGRAIASVFPGIDKTEGLNKAIVTGRLKAFEAVIDEGYGQVLGTNTYQALKQAQIVASTPPTPVKAPFSIAAPAKQGTLPNGTKVTQNPNGTITDAKGNEYDQDGNKKATKTAIPWGTLNLKK